VPKEDLFGEMNALYIKESAIYVAKTSLGCIRRKHFFLCIVMNAGTETVGIL
jgi:hypothetical protein